MISFYLFQEYCHLAAWMMKHASCPPLTTHCPNYCLKTKLLGSNHPIPWKLSWLTVTWLGWNSLFLLQLQGDSKNALSRMLSKFSCSVFGDLFYLLCFDIYIITMYFQNKFSCNDTTLWGRLPKYRNKWSIQSYRTTHHFTCWGAWGVLYDYR